MFVLHTVHWTAWFHLGPVRTNERNGCAERARRSFYHAVLNTIITSECFIDFPHFLVLAERGPRRRAPPETPDVATPTSRFFKYVFTPNVNDGQRRLAVVATEGGRCRSFRFIPPFVLTSFICSSQTEVSFQTLLSASRFGRFNLFQRAFASVSHEFSARHVASLSHSSLFDRWDVPFSRENHYGDDFKFGHRFHFSGEMNVKMSIPECLDCSFIHWNCTLKWSEENYKLKNALNVNCTSLCSSSSTLQWILCKQS